MSPARTETGVRCARCGDLVDVGASFCGNCGARLGGASAQVQSAAPPAASASPPAGSAPPPAASAPPPAAAAPTPLAPAVKQTDPLPAEPPVLHRARGELSGAASTRAAWYGLGLACARAGAWSDAYRHLDRALKDADGLPPDQRVHASLAVAAREAGKPVEEARHLLFAVAKSDRASRADVVAAVSAVAALSDPSMLKTVARSLLRLPGPGEALGCVALAVCGAGEEAQNAALRAASSAPQVLRWALQAMIAPAAPEDSNGGVGLSNPVLLSLAEIAQVLDTTALARRAARRVLELEGQDYAIIGRAHAVLAGLTENTAQRANHLFEAGRNASWSDDDEAAVPLLRAAIEAQPRKEAYWYLAESLRRITVQPDAFKTSKAGLIEARSNWETGWSRGAPDRTYAWAYYVASLIESNLAEIEDDDRVAEIHRWAGLRWTVAGLVLGFDKWDIWGWTALGRGLRTIGARGAAAAATARLLELLGEPSEFDTAHGAGAATADAALQESIASASSLYPPAVSELIAQAKPRQAVAGTEAWISTLEAWDRMRHGSLKAGLEDMRRVVAAGSDAPEFIYSLARALLVNGHAEEGRAAANRLYRRFSGMPTAEQHWATLAAPWAWGALWSGHDEKVESVMQRGVDLTIPGRGRRAEPLLTLAVCALRRDDTDRARGRLDEMLADNPGPGTLIDAVIDVEFGLGPGAGDDVRQFVKRAKRRIRRAYRTSLEPWNAGVGAAVACLAALCPHSEPGAEQTCTAVTVLLLAGIGHWKEAVAAARDLADKDASPLSRELLRWSRASLPRELLTDLRSADAAGAQAIVRSFREAGLKSPDTVAADWRTRLDVPGYWDVHDLASAIPPGPERRLLTGTIAKLDGWLDERLGTSVPSSLASVVAPTPIVLELGGSLIPPGAMENWEEWELFMELIPSMRTAIERDLGVTVPGIRVRANELLTGGEYVILLSEAPFDGGSVPPGYRWNEAPPPEQTASENGGDSRALEQRHPLTGRPGTWTEARASNSAGIDPLRLVMAHLEAVLRSESQRFVVVDDVTRLVNSWVQQGATPELVSLAGEADGLRWLSCVLRRLTLDGVPLSAGPLTAALADEGDRDVERVVRRIRQQVRQELPGNRPGKRHVELPDRFQAAASVSEDGSLRHPPDSAWDLVGAVREAYAEQGDTFTVVVPEPSMAHALERLLQDEVGTVTVIPAEEVGGG